MLSFCTISAPPLSGSGGELDRWIMEIAGGEKEALAELYRATHAAVYGFALSILKNAQDAEDVLQDTYIQVWRGAGSYRSQGKPMAWLLTIARNLSLSVLREGARTVPFSGEDWRTHFAQTAAMTAEDRLTMEALLDELPDQERQIVVLHALTGLKHREIAALLELPLSTVLSKYNRALKKLRETYRP